MKIEIPTAYVKANINIHAGDIVRLKDEGQYKEMEDGNQTLNFTLELTDGQTKIYTMNVTTQKILIQAFGDDSAKWIDKPLKTLIEDKTFKGRLVKSITLIPAEGQPAHDVPIIDDGAPMPEEQ